LGVFFASVVSVLQGCSARDGAIGAVGLLLMGLPSCQPLFSTIYVINFNNDRVVKSNLTGSGTTIVSPLNGLLDEPFGIALNTRPGKMYVTSAKNNRVVRANMDGTLAFELSNLTRHFHAPYGIALGSN
jgi:DNA-binding beta-propeller fold protein YncE